MVNEDLNISLGLDIKAAEAEINRFAQKAAKIFAAIGSSSGQSIDFSSAEKSLNGFANDASTKLKRAFSNAKINDRQFVEPLGKVVRSVSEFDKSMEAANARVLAFGASTGVVLAIQRSFRSLVTTTIEVEKGLKDINVVLNLSDQQLQSFKKSLFDVASNTGQTFAVVAEGAKELSRQGLGATETINRLNDAMILTRLSGLSAEEAVTALTAATNSYTKSLITSRDVVNTIATVDAAFAVSSADLAEGLKRVGSSAEDAGVPFEELVALITATQQITNRGGTVIGNAFKTIFTRLNRPEVLDQLQSLGITVRKASGEVLPAVSILEQYASAAENLSPALRSNIDELIGSVFQINQLKALIKDLNSQYGIYSRALDIANNKTDEAIARNQELNTTLDANIQKTKNTISQFASNLGDTLISGNLKNALDVVNLVFGVDAGTGVGGEFGTGLIRGVADFVAGPGVLLLSSALYGIVRNFVNFAKESFSSIQKTIFTRSEEITIAKELNTYLSAESNLYKDILKGTISIRDAARQVTQEINNQTKAAQRFDAVQAAVRDKMLSTHRVSYVGGKTVLDPKRAKNTLDNNYAAGFAPSPLAQAIEREKYQTGLPISKIKVGQDPRLISPSNPTGLGVYNTRDEPLGLSQGIEREKALGNDPKKAGMFTGKVPSFANNTSDNTAPFLNPIGYLAGSEISQKLDDLADTLPRMKRDMDGMHDAVKKFNKSILSFSQGSLDKAYNQLISDLENAGFDLDERTKLAKNSYDRGAGLLKEYNAGLESGQKQIEKERQLKIQQIESTRRFNERQELEKQKIKETDAKIQSAAELGRKGGIGGFFGINAIRANNQLKAIGTQEADLTRRQVNSEFGNNNKALIASIAGPLVAGVANEFLSNTFFKENPNSSGARATSATLSGFGNIASFAGIGGSFAGPVGAAIGGGAGVITTLINVFNELTNKLPDLTDALRKTTSEITTINDSLSRIQQLRLDLTKATSPKDRVDISSNIIKEIAKLRSKDIQFDGDGNATNFKDILNALENTQFNESLATKVANLKNDPKNEILQNDFLALFSNIKFDGKTLADTLVTGNGGEDVIQQINKANIELKKNKLRASNVELPNVPNFGVVNNQPNSKDITQAEDIKVIENFFKNILPDDAFKSLKEFGGSEIFKLLFDSINNQVEGAKVLSKSQGELNNENLNTIKITRRLNERFVALQSSINFISQINNARKGGRSAVNSLIEGNENKFSSLAGLFSNERSLTNFQFARDKIGIDRELSNGLSDSADTQRFDVTKSINDILKDVNRDLFEIKGLTGFEDAIQKIQDFSKTFTTETFDTDLENLQNDLVNIITQTNDGQSLGRGTNADIFDKLFQSLSDINQARLQNDDALKANAEASKILLESQLDIQKKILSAQEKINFGGGINNLINNDVVENIFRSSRSAVLGTSREQLQGNLQLAEIAETLGLEQPLKDEIVSGLTDQIKRVVNAVGGDIDDKDARNIAEVSFNNKFKKETPEAILSNKLEELQKTFVSQTQAVYSSLETKIEKLADTIQNKFALNLERALLLQSIGSKDNGKFIRENLYNAKAGEEVPDFVVRLKEIEEAIAITKNSISTKNSSSLKTETPIAENLKDYSKVSEDVNQKIAKSIETNKALANSGDELNKTDLEKIKNQRKLVNTNNELASSMAQANAQMRIALIQRRGLSGGQAFVDNLYDSLITNNLELQTNIANSGLELGVHIKDSFKSSISSMIKDIDNFEDAAKQAFVSILDKVTDIGVSNFVDQGLSAITSAIRPAKPFASGGMVTGGSGVRDDVPAVLQGGEFVIRKSMVDKLGKGFFEGLNSSSGSAAITLQNAFEANSKKPTKITDGDLKIDPSLSAFALSDSNNPQNQKRFDTESEFLRYIESLRDYEASIDQAMRAYRKQKRNIITQGFLSAFFNFAALGLGNINAKSSKSTPISKGPLGSTDLDLGKGLPNGQVHVATGGMSKDTIPALLQGGEFVASKNAVDKFGVDFFKRLNEGKINPRRFAAGGVVQSNNTNFVQPINAASPAIDMSPIINSINELSNTLKENKSQNQQSNQPVNNISINVTIQKDGSVQTSQTNQSNQTDDKQSGQRLAEIIKNGVYEVLIKERRPNGMLYVPSR